MRSSLVLRLFTVLLLTQSRISATVLQLLALFSLSLARPRRFQRLFKAAMRWKTRRFLVSITLHAVSQLSCIPMATSLCSRPVLRCHYPQMLQSRWEPVVCFLVVSHHSLRLYLWRFFTLSLLYWNLSWPTTTSDMTLRRMAVTWFYETRLYIHVSNLWRLEVCLVT